MGSRCSLGGITYSGYGNGLAFDTYFDVLFYLVAGLLIVSGRNTWAIRLTALAALNRETAALIPALRVAAALRPHQSPAIERRTLLTAGLCAALFVAEFVGVRLLLGPRPTMVACGHHVGLDTFLFNLTNHWTYFSMVATLSYIPLLALLWFPEWPPVLRRFFWTMVPAWVMVHLFMATLAEVRLFLVPQALIFIPTAFLVSSRDAAERRTSGRDRISVPEAEDPR
ncbi:MAG: hypothetical protein MUO38_00045, partial [Anaerolineales bacterium]|nr:hypothetical protein [Anaerolineales bacterium]